MLSHHLAVIDYLDNQREHGELDFLMLDPVGYLFDSIKARASGLSQGE